MQAEWREAQRRMRDSELSRFVPAAERVKPSKQKAAAADAGGAAGAGAAAADGDDEFDVVEELEQGAVSDDGRTARALAKCGLTSTVRAVRAALRFWLQKNDDGSLVFPSLVSIAFLVLSVPLGIAAVERSFNDLRTIQSRRRLNLSHVNREIEAYLCHNKHLLRGLVLLPEAWFQPPL